MAADESFARGGTGAFADREAVWQRFDHAPRHQGGDRADFDDQHRIDLLRCGAGRGGVPRGRVVEIFGPESSGKTTITLQIIAEAQKLGGMAAFVDAEHALDPAYAKSWVWTSTIC